MTLNKVIKRKKYYSCKSSDSKEPFFKALYFEKDCTQIEPTVHLDT